MMTTWLLTLFIVNMQGTSYMYANFDTRQECISAGESVLSEQTRYFCEEVNEQ
jgi:hypothetical protein